MLNANELKTDILNDMRVELSEEFDRNFERKAFFSDKWKPRAYDYPKGSLLLVTGAMRRSTQGRVEGDGVRFSSALAYAAIHNEGGTGFKPVSRTSANQRKERFTRSAHIHEGSQCRNVSLSGTVRTRSALSGALLMPTCKSSIYH